MLNTLEEWNLALYVRAQSHPLKMFSANFNLFLLYNQNVLYALYVLFELSGFQYHKIVGGLFAESLQCHFLFQQVNLFFLLNIVRVLITKLKDTHKAESNLYMKAVRATLILVPLLGIEFVLFPWRPEGRIAEEVYDYVMHILMHYQVGNIK